MRVTKIVREYIEDRVAERYPLPEKKESVAEFALKELEERCEAFIKAEAESYAKTFVEDFQKIHWRNENDCNEQKIKSFIDNCQAHICSPILKSTIKHNELINSVYNKRAKAVRNIIVELEMGASKADLETLLASLPD